MQQVRPKHRNVFIGDPGAVLNGAKLVTSFSQQGGYWVASGQTQQGQAHGVCEPGFERCNRPEELFLDSVRLRHVSSLSAVGPGRWYMDYSSDRLYMGDNPSGRMVEISAATFAFNGSASDVTIRGLTIEKYANPAQHGAINGKEGTIGAVSQRWVIEDNLIRLNHGGGISIGNEMTIRRNRILNNGQIGVAGEYQRIMRNVVIEDNEIASNNQSGFHAGWEAGGTKFLTTDGLILRRNRVHHNNGPGLWCDTDNINVLYEGNVIEDNTGIGIFHENSYAAVMRNNTVAGNGKGYDTWLWGAQILVTGSPNVEIHNNNVEVDANGGDGIALVQQNRGSGKYGPHVTTNAWVHHNVITFWGTVGYSGAGGDFLLDLLFGATNRFDYNTYRLSRLDYPAFLWRTGAVNWSILRSFGQEPKGTITTLNAITPVDSTPPVISAVTVTNITTSSAVITWTTNEPANEQVNYGTSPSYGNATAATSGRSTSHSVQLTGLGSATQYYFRVQSADANGNAGTATGTFQTPVTGDSPATESGAHWTFNEGAGTVAADSSGNNNTASLQNDAAWAAGRVQGAINLDGVDDFAQVPDSSTLRGNDFSLALWMRSTNMNGIRVLLSKPFGTSNDNSYVLYLNNGRLLFHTTSGNGHINYGTLSANTWYHLVLVKQGTAIRLYLNGAQVGSANGPATVPYDSHPLLLGAENDGRGMDYFFAGLLDQVRVYTRALSTTEVAALAAE